MSTRLVFTGHVVHARPQGSTSYGQPTARMLSSDEQPYRRERVADEQWHELDVGWVDAPGLVVIENRGDFTMEVSTRAARTQVHPPQCDFYVPPGECHRYTPADAKSWRLRCPDGECAYVVVAIPR